MKGVATLIRLQRHALVERKKALALLTDEAARINQAIVGLESGLVHEKQLASQDPTLARSFPMFLQATLKRRAALANMLADVARRIAAAESEIADVFRELKAFELAEKDARDRAAHEAAQHEQKKLDEIGGAMHRRVGGTGLA